MLLQQNKIKRVIIIETVRKVGTVKKKLTKRKTSFPKVTQQ